MLRISYSQTDTAQQWKLCGQLAGTVGQGAALLLAVRVREQTRGSGAVVDLRDVTLIDADGEQLLSEMQNAGASFIAAGVETKHLIENLPASKES